MKNLMLFVFTLFFSTCSLAANISQGKIDSADGQRSYLLASPSPSSSRLLPLVVLLHGHTGSAAQLFRQERSVAPLSVWLQIADREGLLVAALDGVIGPDGHTGWNDCRADAPGNPSTDDVGFIDSVIEKLVAQSNADPTRVYIMGMSNGGMMTFRFASERPQRVAAFATVGASIAAQSKCTPAKVPVSALIISGTADPLVPYIGGAVAPVSKGTRGSVLPAVKGVSLWRSLAGLPTEPTKVEAIPSRSTNDTTRAVRNTWLGGTQGLEIVFLRIDGGGHVEPSPTQRFSRIYKLLVGAQNADIETAEEAWRFFESKKK